MTDRDRPPAEEEHDRTWTALPRLWDSSEKHAFLLVLAGPDFGEIFPLEPGRELLLGRREDVDLQIRDDGVSRRHASLRVEGHEALLTDLGSANGTYVDGKRVLAARVGDGARLHVGAHTTLKFIWADELDARYQMKLAQGALQDALTGLYNRRHFDERLGVELAAAQRHRRPVSLLLVDVDHFKSVNDAHGHLAGDEALRVVASLLRATVRKEDVLARYGGEEFVVIARETARDGARVLGERIRRAVERSRCAWLDAQLALTVSVGVAVASAPRSYEPGRSEREMIRAADRALYLAKEQGRNRLVVVPVEASRGPGEASS